MNKMSEEIKISQLQEANEISDNDLMMIIQNKANKKVTFKQIKKNIIKVEELQIVSSVTDITLRGYRIGNLCFVDINGSGETFTKGWTNYELGKITGITAKNMTNSIFTNQNGQTGDISIYANQNNIQLNYRAITPISTNSWIRGQLVFVCN